MNHSLSPGPAASAPSFQGHGRGLRPAGRRQRPSPAGPGGPPRRRVTLTGPRPAAIRARRSTGASPRSSTSSPAPGPTPAARIGVATWDEWFPARHELSESFFTLTADFALGIGRGAQKWVPRELLGDYGFTPWETFDATAIVDNASLIAASPHWLRKGDRTHLIGTPMSRANEEAPQPAPARPELGPTLPLGEARGASGDVKLPSRLRIEDEPDGQRRSSPPERRRLKRHPGLIVICCPHGTPRIGHAAALRDKESLFSDLSGHVCQEFRVVRYDLWSHDVVCSGYFHGSMTELGGCGLVIYVLGHSCCNRPTKGVRCDSLLNSTFCHRVL
jgi:hypothetical protein